MSMTLKVLGEKAGKEVEVGEYLVLDVDLVYAHDGTAPLAIDVMREEFGVKGVKDPSKVVFVIDHAAPAPHVEAAFLHSKMRAFAKEQGIKVMEVGEGISHQVLPEKGFVRPYSFIVGSDSHTVTLGAFGAFATGVGSTDAAIAMMTGKLWVKVPEQMRVELVNSLRDGVMARDLILTVIGEVKADGANYMSVEFTGDGVKKLSVDSRMVLSNMTVEMGAKAGLVEVDSLTLEWLSERGVKGRELHPDRDAEYEKELEYDLSRVEPVVSVPHNVDNVKPVTEVEGVEVDQAFIGSCSGGRFEDFYQAARILRGRKVKVRCIAVPASRNVYMSILRAGIAEELVKAGCTLGPATCGPCIGAHMGILGPDEVAVSTSTRNFQGRRGHSTSRVYLASPATAAASAVTGRLTDPRSLL